MKKWLTLGLGLVIGIAINYALIGQGIDAIRDEIANARYIFLIPCAVLLIGSLITRAVRWQVLLNGQLSLWHSIHITNIGYFFSAIIPFRIGDARTCMVNNTLNSTRASL